MGILNFHKTLVGSLSNPVLPGDMNTFITVGDVDGDGLPDVVVSGRNGKMAWFQNTRREGQWIKHHVADVNCMECGGSIADITGNGLGDIINGGDWRSDEVWWWENPGENDLPWTRRTIAKTGYPQIHDTLICDVKNDGRKHLVFTNQGGREGMTVYCVPIPDDPTICPWPGLEAISEGLREGSQPEEGLAFGDINGDGKNELVSGTHWFTYSDGRWISHKFAQGYITTKLAVSDIDGDGRMEIVVSEGDPCIYGRPEGGRLASFKPGDDIDTIWEEHVIDENLLDAHSLRLADICGHGRPDLVVGEIGVADDKRDYTIHPPRIMVYENEGQGRFTRHVIDTGTGIHDAVLVDTLGRGKLDIVGKPLHGPERWNIHAYIAK